MKNKKNNKKLKKILSTTYKTKKCEFYNRGNCQKGKDCTFSHNFIPDHGKVSIYLIRRNYANIFLVETVRRVNNALILIIPRDIHANFSISCKIVTTMMRTVDFPMIHSWILKLNSNSCDKMKI